MEIGRRKLTRIGICLALALATAAVFWQVTHHEFVNFDDPDYVTENPHVNSGLTLDNVVWAFAHSHVANWHPLTWISHMLDCQLFGLNAGAHHAVSLLIHIASAILLFLVLDRMTNAPWRSAVVAGLFALHPLHVESVAWAAERKDTLSALFFMLTLWAYVGYVKRRRVRFYLLVVLFFTLGLLSKPMLVTLPLVLLLLDFWPLRRLAAANCGGAHGTGVGELVLEKVPLFLLSAVSSVVTFWTQKHSGAVVSTALFPVSSRVANALISCVRYIGKTVWPTGLAVPYPRPPAWSVWQAVAAGSALAVLTIVLAGAARRRRYLLVGWFWFLGMLAPVIGLIQVGTQAMADRYTYLPLVGLFVAIVWGIADLSAGLNLSKLSGVAAAVALILCAFASSAQLRFWRNGPALFEHTLAVTPDNALAHNEYGAALAAAGRFAEALAHYSEAARLEPGDAVIQNNLGTALAREGKLDDAMVHYREAIRLKPDYAEAYCNLGANLSAKGRYDEAVANLTRAISLDPRYAEAHNNLGAVLAGQEKHAEAILQYEEALRIDPGKTKTRFNLGLSLVKIRRIDEAIAQFSRVVRADPAAVEAGYQLGRCLAVRGQVKAGAAQLSEVVRLKPDHAGARFSLGVALIDLKQTRLGMEHLREAIRLRPNWPDPLNALAWILATDENGPVRNGPEAVRLAEKAAELTGRSQPLALNTLAAAYAEAGRFDEAVDAANKALDLARSSGQTNLAERIQAGLDSYKARRPFRQSLGGG